MSPLVDLEGAFDDWAVSCFMVFLDAARYRLQSNVWENEYRIWNTRVLPSPEGPLVPLPRPLIQLIRELGVQNIVRDTEYGVEEAKALLFYVL